MAFEHWGARNEDGAGDMSGPGAGHGLTTKQRAAVIVALDRLHIDVEDPAERNAKVPRGNDVATPEVLRHLPKRPPDRR